MQYRFVVIYWTLSILIITTIIHLHVFRECCPAVQLPGPRCCRTGAPPSRSSWPHPPLSLGPWPRPLTGRLPSTIVLRPLDPHLRLAESLFYLFLFLSRLYCSLCNIFGCDQGSDREVTEYNCTAPTWSTSKVGRISHICLSGWWIQFQIYHAFKFDTNSILWSKWVDAPVLYHLFAVQYLFVSSCLHMYLIWPTFTQ